MAAVRDPRLAHSFVLAHGTLLSGAAAGIAARLAAFEAQQDPVADQTAHSDR
jgi:hypothetical protein